MSDVVAGPRPDTTDMVAVHKVFRDALGAAPQVLGAAASGTPEHARNVASYYANVLAFLHVHHEGEDELLWPKLLERCPAEAARVSEIADQHHGVTTALRDAEAHLFEWAEKPDVNRAATLASALTVLNAELTPHLDQEEEFVLPLAAEHLSIEEWAAFPAHGMQHFSGDKIWLVLGSLLDAMTPVQRENMLTHMPPPVHEFWVTAGKPQYESFIADVLG
jgi:hemerythrin-like domain-containing protein